MQAQGGWGQDPQQQPGGWPVPLLKALVMQAQGGGGQGPGGPQLQPGGVWSTAWAAGWAAGCSRGLAMACSRGKATAG